MSTESLKLVLPDKNDSDILNWMATLYYTAFSTGAWVTESHDRDGVLTKIKTWIKDENHYRVVCGMVDDERVGFAVTRREPLKDAASSLFGELEAVSGITLGDDEKELVYSKLLTLLDYASIEEFTTKASSADLVGFFQDVVVEDRFRGQGHYNQLMLPLTMELLADANVRLIIVYTNPNVSMVVNTLEEFGGVCIYRGQVLVYAATTDTIKKRMSELGLT